MVTKRQKQAAGLAAAALLLVGSAYAWSSTNQHKTNEFKRKSSAANDVTLVENFEPVEDWQESQTVNKDISVKNNTATVGGSNAYVRINLREFLEFTGRKETLSDVRYAVTTAGDFAKYPNTPAGLAAAQAYATANGLDAADIVVVPTTAYDGDDQYFIKTKEGSYHGQYGKFLVLGFEDDSAPVSIIGGTNASEDAKRDPNSDGDESDGKHQDATNGEDAYYLQQFAATGTTLNAKRNYTTLNTGVPNGDGIAPGTNLNNYITWNFGANVMMLEDYNATTVTTGKWIIDKSTGWVYWSNPLLPGQTTDLFLDSLTLTESPRNVALYYAIHTNLEAVDASGIDGLGTIPDEIKTSWDKGKNTNTGSAVTVPSTTPGSEFTFAGSQWRILDTDMDDDASNGLQALVIKVDKIGDTMFNTAATSSTLYYTAATGTNGYTQSASGGLKQTIDDWYTATIASDPALASKVNSVNLNLPDFAAFKSGITFSSGSTNADWVWQGSTPYTATNNFSQDIRFKTTLDNTAAGAKQAFALSYGDIHTHMQVPVGTTTTSLLAFGGSDYTWLRSSCGSYASAGMASAAGQFSNATSLSQTRGVHPALSLTIQ